MISQGLLPTSRTKRYFALTVWAFISYRSFFFVWAGTPKWTHQVAANCIDFRFCIDILNRCDTSRIEHYYSSPIMVITRRTWSLTQTLSRQNFRSKFVNGVVVTPVLKARQGQKIVRQVNLSWICHVNNSTHAIAEGTHQLICLPLRVVWLQVWLSVCSRVSSRTLFPFLVVDLNRSWFAFMLMKERALGNLLVS